MARTAIGVITIFDVQDGADGGGRGAGRWNHRVGTALNSSYTNTQLDGFLAAAIPGTDVDDPVVSDQLWLFASPSTSDLTPTAQLVYLCTAVDASGNGTWNLQEEVVDGDLLVSGTVTLDKLQAQTGANRIVINGNGIGIYNSNVLRVAIGDLSAIT